MRAAFFDMDRTVLRRDSGMSWMRFLRRRGELSLSDLMRALWWSSLYKLAVLDLEALAERLVANVAGDSERAMVEKCRVWYEADGEALVTRRAERAIAAHRARGEMVVLLTGSTQYIADVVARSLAIEHSLSSRVEVVGGYFTGRIEQLCFGRHKVAVAERFARRHGIDLDRSVFYSDSYNDLPMLQRVGKPVVVNPDARLFRHARRARWEIRRWA